LGFASIVGWGQGEKAGGGKSGGLKKRDAIREWKQLKKGWGERKGRKVGGSERGKRRGER